MLPGFVGSLGVPLGSVMLPGFVGGSLGVAPGSLVPPGEFPPSGPNEPGVVVSLPGVVLLSPGVVSVLPGGVLPSGAGAASGLGVLLSGAGAASGLGVLPSGAASGVVAPSGGVVVSVVAAPVKG